MSYAKNAIQVHILLLAVDECLKIMDMSESGRCTNMRAKNEMRAALEVFRDLASNNGRYVFQDGTFIGWAYSRD